jgi:hypothetical protein
MFNIRESNKLGTFIYSCLFRSKPYLGLRIYTTLPKVCGDQLVEHLITKLWALIWSWSLFAAITASTLLQRLSTRCWNIAALMLGDWALSRSSNSSQRCLMGLRSGLCAGQSSSSTPTPTNHFCMDHFVHEGNVMLKQERAYHKLLPQSWNRIV